MKGPVSKDEAIKDFEKKFKDKTKNSWADRGKFKPVKGKYTLIEMADEDDDDEVDATVRSYIFLLGITEFPEYQDNYPQTVGRNSCPDLTDFSLL